LVEKSQAIEHQRFDGCPDREVPHCRVLGRRLSEDVAKPEFVAQASDKAEVVSHLATVCGLVGHDHLLLSAVT
jgi:hypothetical protein